MKTFLSALLIFISISVFAQKNTNRTIKQASILAENGKPDLAISQFDNILDSNPECVKALLGRGEAFLLLGKYDDAAADFERALEIDSKNARALFLAGREKHRNKDFKGASLNYEKALKHRFFDNDLFYLMAKAKMSLGDNVGAIYDLDFILDQEFDNVPALLQRGIALQNLKMYKEADIYLSKAIKFNDKYSTTYSYRGVGRVEMGNNIEALEDLSQAVDLGEERNDAFYYRGLSRYKLGDHDGAVSDLVESKRRGYLEAVNTLSLIGNMHELDAKSR